MFWALLTLEIFTCASGWKWYPFDKLKTPFTKIDFICIFLSVKYERNDKLDEKFGTRIPMRGLSLQCFSQQTSITCELDHLYNAYFERQWTINFEMSCL